MLSRTKLFIVGYLFAFSLSSIGQTSMLTGQAAQSVAIGPGLALQYQSDIAVKEYSTNEISPAGWVGLGWSLGFPSITVSHNNTVSMYDDKWYYNDGSGNMQEIVRVYEGATPVEKFYLRNNPYFKISVIDNTPSSGQLRIIKGWEITSTDGTISRFGNVNGGAVDAVRSVPSWGNSITKGIKNASTPVDFYYRWDIKEMEDINHQKTVYSYGKISRTTSTVFSDNYS